MATARETFSRVFNSLHEEAPRSTDIMRLDDPNTFYDPSSGMMIKQGLEPTSTIVATPKPLLNRMELPEADLENEHHQLATKAATLLGYNRLSEHLQLAGALGKVLNELHIQPFNREDVEAYKTWVVQQKTNVEISRIDRFNNGWSWHLVEISEYQHPIPEFALRKAVQVKEKMPEAHIWVEYLRYNPDPFLVVGNGEEIYWIEVWDEPKFESQHV